MKVIIPWLVLGAVAIALIGCGSNLNTPQNLWNVTLNSTQFNTQTSFSFFETINGTTLTGSGVTFLSPSPCFGNTTNPSGITITGQIGNTNTPGQSTLTMQMQYTSNGVTNTLTMTGLFSNGLGVTSGSGNFTLIGNTGGACPNNDSGSFSQQTAL